MDKLNRLLPAVALGGMAAVLFFLRLHTYDEPLERDITTYAVIAHEMLDGRSLYSDLFDHKPPAIHVTYAIGELIIGRGRAAVFLVNISAAIATMLGCYFAGRAASGGRAGGLISAGLWVLASGDLALGGNQPNTEVFINALVAAAFCIFARAVGGELRRRDVLVAGVLFGLASLYKQVVVAPAALLSIVALFSVPKRGFGKTIVDLALFSAMGAILWAVVVGYFAVRSHLGAFMDAVFTFNRWYSGGAWQNLRQIATWPLVAPDVLATPVLLATISLTGVVLGFTFGPRRQWILLLALLLGTHIAVLLPGQFYPHYYQLWLPPLAIGAGWTVALLKRILPVRLSLLPYGAAAATCGILAILEMPYYQLSAQGWSVRKYGTIFLDADRMASRIDKLLPPGATFYEWGNESGFYFTTERRPPSGVIFALPAMGGPLRKRLAGQLIDDLDRNKPELIVAEVQTLAMTQDDHPLLKWFNDNYQPYSKTIRFMLFVRKGGQLAMASN